MKPIFRKICNSEISGLKIVKKKNAQIEAFRRFLDFVSLVYHFAHNDKWA